MKKSQTIEVFSRERGIVPAGISRFNVFKNERYCTEPHIYNRRDFNKISLLEGSCKLSWHHQDIYIDKPALVFYNPLTPFAWHPVSKEQPGFFCFFKKEFINESGRNEAIDNALLQRLHNNPVVFLNKKQQKNVRMLFLKMYEEVASDYVFRYDILRNYLSLLIHEALKITPKSVTPEKINASRRISMSFFQLLETQFPIDSTERFLRLRTAGDYAKALSIHVNHLNHALMETTGKPTSVHIAERILAEAKALLKHTGWPIADIAYSLGFEYPNYFNNFFRKRTGHTPRFERSGMI